MEKEKQQIQTQLFNIRIKRKWSEQPPVNSRDGWIGCKGKIQPQDVCVKHRFQEKTQMG